MHLVSSYRWVVSTPNQQKTHNLPAMKVEITGVSSVPLLSIHYASASLRLSIEYISNSITSRFLFNNVACVCFMFKLALRQILFLA